MTSCRKPRARFGCFVPASPQHLTLSYPTSVASLRSLTPSPSHTISRHRVLLDEETTPVLSQEVWKYHEHRLLTRPLGGLFHDAPHFQLKEEFFDTPNFDLLYDRMWLRCRGGQWSLKVMFQPEATMSTRVLEYIEYTDEKEILQNLLSSAQDGDLLDKCTATSLEELIARGLLTCYQSFHTERIKPRKTMIPNLEYWLDRTSIDGHSIEIFAMEAHDKFARSLFSKASNLFDLGLPVPGKIVSYLTRYRSDILFDYDPDLLLLNVPTNSWQEVGGLSINILDFLLIYSWK